MAIQFNEDFENFMAFHDPDEMNEPGLRKQVDAYFQSQISTIYFCVNAQRAYYDSKAFDPAWKGVEKHSDGRYYHRGEEVLDKPLPTLSNTIHAKALHEAVGNPFQIRIDQCRRNGGKGCLSMRMNDCHLSDFPKSPMHSDFWYEHPEWRLERWRTEQNSGRGLNYAVPEVRHHAMALLEEIFSIYDLDGLEIDWMRTPPFFPEGEEDANRGTADEIVHYAFEQKLLAEKRLRHPVLLSVRVPSRPEEALRLGLDVTHWARKGWIDQAVPCAFIGSADASMPIEIWRALLPEGIRLVPGIDILTRSHELAKAIHNEPEIVNGYAAAFFHRGADDIYLFNHMDRLTGLRDKAAFRRMIRQIGTRESAEKTFRRHVATMCQNLVPGIRSGSSLPLPAGDWWQQVRIEVGGGLKGREISLLFAFQAGDTFNPAQFEFAVNGVKCLDIRRETTLALPDPTWKTAVCTAPADVVREGSALAAFRALDRGNSAVLQWCEIDIASATEEKSSHFSGDGPAEN